MKFSLIIIKLYQFNIKLNHDSDALAVTDRNNPNILTFKQFCINVTAEAVEWSRSRGAVESMPDNVMEYKEEAMGGIRNNNITVN